jgi:pimeloyl-ACP methyl ester carboxylesterase
VVRITAPTLLIYGEPGFGGIVTPDIAKAAQELNPQIETVQLAGAGHNTRRENFDAYRVAVVAFLAKI